MSARVSVVVTCYNLGQYLREAIGSVSAQTFTDHDTLIVDDGSTDPATIACIDELAASGTPVLRTTNRGLPAARNAGIERTTGDYICCLDADDVLEPTWLERGVTLLDASPELAYASHWLRAFGEEEWPWQPMRCDLGRLLDINTLNGAALFRRSLWHAIGGFDASMREGCEDWEFWIRATTAGFRGAIVPEVQHAYRRRAESMSRTMNHERLYGGLIERHPSAYQEHLLDLLLRREQTIATLQRSIEDMETEVESVLTPALDERAHELTRARQRLHDIRRVQELARRVEEQEAMLDAAAESTRHSNWQRDEQVRRAEWLATERDELLRRLTVVERLADESRQRATTLALEAASEVEKVRQSWSWRVTTPLRWLGDVVVRGRRSA